MGVFVHPLSIISLSCTFGPRQRGTKNTLLLEKLKTLSIIFLTLNSGMSVVPGWRGKYFDCNSFSNWGWTSEHPCHRFKPWHGSCFFKGRIETQHVIAKSCPPPLDYFLKLYIRPPPAGTTRITLFEYISTCKLKIIFYVSNL